MLGRMVRWAGLALFLGLLAFVAAEKAFGQVIEQGPSFDKEIIGYDEAGKTVIRHSFVAERIQYDDDWINYKHTETDTEIRFESAAVSLIYDKNACGLRVYDSGRMHGAAPVIGWYQTILKQAPNGTTNWTDSAINSESCSMTPVTDLGNGITFNSTKQNGDGIFNIRYVIHFSLGMEDFYEYTNTNPSITDMKYGFTVVQESVRDLQIGGTVISKGMLEDELTLDRDFLIGKKIIFKNPNGRDLTFDPKDETHEALLLQRAKPTQDVFDFTNIHKPLGVGKTITVDPTTSYDTAGTFDFTVPAGVTVIDVKAWGAGGTNVSAIAKGGGGGFAGARISVTPDDILKIVVGSSTGGGAGGSGGSGCAGRFGGDGGGYSGVFFPTVTHENVLVIGGGGGGSGGVCQSSGQVGRAGGGAEAANTNGGGGTNSTGGNGGTGLQTAGTAGSALTGGAGGGVSGSDGHGGGGGGAGYYGGGGGAGSSQFGGAAGGGGGGSNNATATATQISLIAGSGATAGNPSDPDRPPNAGHENTAGAVVLIYVASAPPTDFACDPIGVNIDCTWTASTGQPVDDYFIGLSFDNSTWNESDKTNVGNVTAATIPAPSAGTLVYMNITSSYDGVGNSTSSTVISLTTDNVPDAPTLSLVLISATQINATSTAGASDGGDPVKDFGLRCGLDNRSISNIVNNSTLPADRTHTFSLDVGFTGEMICQWRDGNLVGFSDWSAQASVTVSGSTYVPPTTFVSNQFTIPWNSTITNAIVIDANNDGIADTVYSRSGSTITKQWGDVDLLDALTLSISDTVLSTFISDDYIWITTASGASCTARTVNMASGVQQSLSTGSHGGTTTSNGGAWNATDGTPYILCSGTGGSDTHYYYIKTPTATVCSGTATSGSSVVSPSVLSGRNSTNTCGYDLDGQTGYAPAAATTPPTFSKYNINTWNDVKTRWDFDAPTPTNGAIDRSIRTYFKGIEFRGSSFIPNDTLAELQDKPWTAKQVFLHTHHEILGLPSDGVRFLMVRDGLQYVGVLIGDGQLYFAPFPDLSDRRMQFYMADDVSGTDMTATAKTLTEFDYLINTPTTEETVTGLAGSFSLLSGYNYQREAGILQSVKPSLPHLASNQPLIIGQNSSLTQLSMIIKNAPVSAPVAIGDSLTVQGTAATWKIDTVDADRGFAVDIPTGRCVNIFLFDLTIWHDLGSLCASGTMPKQIAYSSDLSFTFWTLPWGTSTRYDFTTDSVQTIVRNNEADFIYNVNIFDRNGTTAYSQQFIGNDLDVQTWNLTGVQKPARLVISDSSNKTLHHVTLGVGNWLEQIQAFSNQHLEIDGFNMLFLMPLIFGAIWTRNTVSMGTMMTVVAIMTFVYFGVFSLPDIVLYAMLFIAAIGMVAYRLLY